MPWRATLHCSRAKTTSRKRGASSIRSSRQARPSSSTSPGAGVRKRRRTWRRREAGKTRSSRREAARARAQPTDTALKIEVLPDPDRVARRAAAFIAGEARSAVQARGRFTLAVSGGRTPWQMLRALAGLELPWSAVDLYQVDERVAPAGDGQRNLTHIRESLLDK